MRALAPTTGNCGTPLKRVVRLKKIGDDDAATVTPRAHPQDYLRDVDSWRIELKADGPFPGDLQKIRRSQPSLPKESWRGSETTSASELSS